MSDPILRSESYDSLLPPSSIAAGDGEVAAGRIVVVAGLASESDFSRLHGLLPPGNASGIDLYGGYRDAAAVYEGATTLGADVALLDPNLAGFTAELVQRLLLFEPKPIITIGAIPGAGDWAQSVATAGAKGHINTPLDTQQVAKLISMIPALLKQAWAERASPKYIPRMDPRMTQIIDRGGWQRTTISVWSPKGGVGKTFLAVNLGCALGVVANRKTVIVDADMNAGNVHTHLRLSKAKNIFALATTFAAYRNQITAEMVNEHLSRYRGNLFVLVGIPTMSVAGEAPLAGAQGGLLMEALLGVLRERLHFDFIVLDLGQSYHNDIHLRALELSDKNLLVVTPEVPAVLDLKNALPPLERMVRVIDPARFKLVLNRYNEELGVTRKDILKALQLPEFAAIPDGGSEVSLSINRHEPVVLAGKRNPLSDALIGMSNGFYPYLNEIWMRPTLARTGQTLMERLLGRPV